MESRPCLRDRAVQLVRAKQTEFRISEFLTRFFFDKTKMIMVNIFIFISISGKAFLLQQK